MIIIVAGVINCDFDWGGYRIAYIGNRPYKRRCRFYEGGPIQEIEYVKCDQSAPFFPYPNAFFDPEELYVDFNPSSYVGQQNYEPKVYIPHRPALVGWHDYNVTEEESMGLAQTPYMGDTWTTGGFSCGFSSGFDVEWTIQ